MMLRYRQELNTVCSIGIISLVIEYMYEVDVTYRHEPHTVYSRDGWFLGWSY